MIVTVFPLQDGMWEYILQRTQFITTYMYTYTLRAGFPTGFC